MGAGASGQPIYLTRSTMLISHTPMSQIPSGPQFRRQSTMVSSSAPTSSSISSGGISSQLAFPIQMYPNNVYHNHGQSAQVSGFQAPRRSSAHPPTSSTSSPQLPNSPTSETPPTYSSIYPNIAGRVAH